VAAWTLGLGLLLLAAVWIGAKVRLSDHGTDLATTEHGDEPQFPLPPHHARLSDTRPSRGQGRRDAGVDHVRPVGGADVAFVVVYFAFPTNHFLDLGPFGVVQTSNFLLGITFGLGPSS